MKSWKTTSAGIALIASGIISFYFAAKNNKLDEAVVTASITSVISGCGLIFAKDKNVTGGTVLNSNNDPAVVQESAQ